MTVEDTGVDVPTPRGGRPAAAPPPGFVSSEAFRAAGVSYRRLDYWTRLGLLRAVQATPGSGTPRRWPEQELSIARAMVRLCDKLGLRLDQAGPLARAAVEDPTLHWQPIPRCPGLEIRIGPEVWAE